MRRDYKDTTEKHHSLIIAGHHLYYREIGTGSPLVMLHGYGVSGYMWQRVLPYFAQHYHVFIVDLPGHGQTRARLPWQLRTIAPLLVQWLRQMEIAPVILMGQSMGGAIAIHITAEHPELVKQLVLVSAAGLPLEAQFAQLVVRSIRSATQRGGRYPLLLLRDVAQPRFRVLWQAAQEMTISDFRTEITTVAQLQLPTLIIWGEQDLLLPISLGYGLQAALPHATFITMPNSGHRPMLSEPEHFSRIVLQFLQQHNNEGEHGLS